VNTCVDISKARMDCKYKLFTERDTDFHNLIIIDLLNCMSVNGTLHIMHAVAFNEFLNNKTRG
jgi:hypothetical protein